MSDSYFSRKLATYGNIEEAFNDFIGSLDIGTNEYTFGCPRYVKQEIKMSW